MEKKKSVLKILIQGLLILAFIIIVVIGVVITLMYQRNKMNSVKTEAIGYAKAISEIIDGDTVKRYLVTKKKDDYYDKIQNLINQFQENTNITYLYIMVPEEHDFVYIWDADTKGNACPLGYREEYSENGEETRDKVFKKDPEDVIMGYKEAPYGYMAGVFYPLFDSTGEPVALVGIDLAMPGIESEIARFVMSVAAIIAILIIFFVTIYVHVMRRLLIEPIIKLKKSAEQMIENLESDDNTTIDIHSGNEFDALARSFETMRDEVKDYLGKLTKVTAEKERIGAELDIATNIQSSMLPSIFPPFPDIPEVDIYATMDPAKEVGGDFYDFFMVDSTHLAFVVADVSGKGVPAALFMVIAKTLIKDHTLPGKDLGDIFYEVNNILCESNAENLFVTVFEGVVDLETGEFVFCDAGHEIPFICRANGTFEPQEKKGSFVLAGMEDMTYNAGSIMLKPGDRVFQYSDGAPEATNLDEELFGMDRLKESLNKHSDGDLKSLLTNVRADIDEFVGEADQFDDITMLCFELKSLLRR